MSVVQDSVNTAGCNGGTDGAAYISVTGGVSGFTYLWSDASSNEDLTNVSAGAYNVTVTDVNSCTSQLNVDIFEDPFLTLQLIDTDVSCNGAATGAINLTVNGGVPNFTYNWSNGSANEDLSGLPAATYTVTVTDANGCSESSFIVISQPSAINLSSIATDVDCNGAATGSIDLTVFGGLPLYSFIWSNGSISEDPSGLISDTYTVTVTDANSCTATTSVLVSEPSVINLSSLVSDVACNGGATGAVNLTVSGGTPGYTYNWSNGSSNEDITGLIAGTYTVTVTDANNCTSTTSATVTQTTSVNLSTVVTNVACNGASTGAVNLTVSGGTPGYTYNWSNGSSNEDITGLIAGTYTVTVTDANNCTATTSATVTQATAINLSTVVTNVGCNGASTGAVNLTVSGGAPGYTYNWSNGSSNEDISGLIAGTYTVTVTDVNNCTATTNAIVTQTTSINLSTVVTNVACNGASTGAVNLTVSGGAPGYTYNWSNGSSNEDISALIAGTYTVTVTDANNCTATTSASVTQTNAINLSTVVSNVACNGASTGAVNLTVSGGTPGYTYNWSNGSSNEDISALIAGTYTVTVTDANNCTATTSALVSQASAINLSPVVTNIACNGGASGAINLTVSGGTPGFTYNWSNGSSTEDISGLTAATYTVTVTDANNCTASDCRSIYSHSYRCE
ncbi:MAG: SprB repeat-containing protein [Bacteroidetes bacterium]|nr:SprB repeat-containing protein [Bacteroidota bacterium]